MRHLIKTFILAVGILASGLTSAYTHVRDLPKDFNHMYCFTDKELIQYQSRSENNIRIVPPTHQVVSFTHKSIIDAGSVNRSLPTGPVYAYDYMCSYKDSYGRIKNVWASYIYKDKFGKVLPTYVIVPGDYKKPLIYSGKTYANWVDWYNDNFFDDEEVDSKYKNINSLEYFYVEIKKVYDRTMNFRGYSHTPLYKFRYVGSLYVGSKKFHTWETYENKSSETKAWIYTLKPYPPKFEDRVKWIDKSSKLY